MIPLVAARGPSAAPVQNGTHHVLGALADLVADLAFGEDLLSGGGVLRERHANRSKERRPGNQKTQKPHIILRIRLVSRRTVRDASLRGNAGHLAIGEADG